MKWEVRGSCTCGEQKAKEAREGALEESQNQASLPLQLLKEKDAAELGGHLHHARNHLCEVGVHSQFLHPEAQHIIVATDSKPGIHCQKRDT